MLRFWVLDSLKAKHIPFEEKCTIFVGSHHHFSSCIAKTFPVATEYQCLCEATCGTTIRGHPLLGRSVYCEMFDASLRSVSSTESPDGATMTERHPILANRHLSHTRSHLPSPPTHPHPTQRMLLVAKGHGELVVVAVAGLAVHMQRPAVQHRHPQLALHDGLL